MDNYTLVKSHVIDTLILQTVFSESQMISRLNAILPPSFNREDIPVFLNKMVMEKKIIAYEAVGQTFYHLEYVV
jgi:hypothetical protein